MIDVQCSYLVDVDLNKKLEVLVLAKSIQYAENGNEVPDFNGIEGKFQQIPLSLSQVIAATIDISTSIYCISSKKDDSFKKETMCSDTICRSRTGDLSRVKAAS